MLTNEDLVEIVCNITYRPGWSIILDADGEGRPFVQISVGTDSEASLSPFTGEREAWKSGKHYLSRHMCRQEVVGAVYGAIRGAEEHEMREWFRYRGASIYNPHLDPDRLAEFASKRRNFDFRENAMSMIE